MIFITEKPEITVTSAANRCDPGTRSPKQVPSTRSQVSNQSATKYQVKAEFQCQYKVIHHTMIRCRFTQRTLATILLRLSNVQIDLGVHMAQNGCCCILFE